MFKLVGDKLICPAMATDLRGSAAKKLFESSPWVHKVMREVGKTCGYLGCPCLDGSPCFNSQYATANLAIDSELAYLDYLKRKDSGQ